MAKTGQIGKETQAKSVKGTFSTAEVTHVLEAIQLEGQCYIKNHVLMAMGEELSKGAVREWHDSVTKPNLDALVPVAEKMGLDLPFPKPLEDRENEMKSKMGGAKLAGVVKDGEILAEVKTAGTYLSEFYTTSINLATDDAVREAFRRARENVTDGLPKVLASLKETDNYYPPPIAKEIGYVAEKGVAPSESQRG